MRPLAAVLVVSASILASQAAAQWPAGGKQVAIVTPFSKGTPDLQLFETVGGDFLIRAAVKQSTYTSHSVARMDQHGNAVPGYPTYVGLGGALQGVNTEQRGFATDASGHFWYSSCVNAGPANQTMVQEIHPDGTLLPNGTGWVLAAAPGAIAWNSAIAPGEVGDIYVLAGSSRLRHVLPSGVQSPTWPVNGVNVPGDPGYLNASLLPDGTGGVIWFTPYGSAGVPCALRVDSTGLRHAGWPATELPLSNDPVDGEFNSGEDFREPLIRSDDTHFIAMWGKRAGASTRNIKLQRFSQDGQVDPSWPPAGVLIDLPADANSGPSLIADGNGGAYVLWHKNDLPVGTHVLASGQVMGSPKTSLLPAGAAYARPRGEYVPSSPIRYVMADRTPDGRIVFAWDDPSVPALRQIRVRWLLPDLTPDPSEPSVGRLILPAALGPNEFVRGLRVVHADDVGGAYVGWEVFHRLSEQQVDFAQVEVWMTRILPSALLDAPHATPGTSAIALSSPRPNPTRDAISLELTLATDAPAKLELLDVAGRVLRSRMVEGAGRHSLAFTGLHDLPPGLYFLRATANGESQRTRVVLTR